VAYDDNGNCVSSDGSTYDGAGNLISSGGVTQVGATTTFNTTLPVAQQSTGTLLSPTSTADVGGAYGAIGSNGGCAAGYVVADAAGNCAPAATVASTLGTAAGAASLGLTSAQAAAALAALNTATNAVKAATGQTVAPVVVASSNPFASISTTVWIAGAGLLALVLVISKKR
jgi:hypothetical protein